MVETTEVTPKLKVVGRQTRALNSGILANVTKRVQQKITIKVKKVIPLLPCKYFGLDTLIPPHLGDPRLPDQRSPYPVTIEELAKELSFNKHRVRLLNGLIGYRKALRACGVDGYQWIDGSFVEHKENRLVPDIPNDIDILTIIRTKYAPESSEFLAFQQSIKPLFDVVATKLLYRCDAYPIFLFENLGNNPSVIIKYTLDIAHYWYGLFSHSRDGAKWKGILEVQLASSDDDQSVLTSLAQLTGATK